MNQRVEHVVGVLSRFGERLLPIPLLLLAILPAVMAIGKHLVLRGISLSRHRQFVAAMKPREAGWRSLWRVWAGRTAVCTTRFLSFWPDRLRQARWRRRCQFIGWERLQTPLAEGRPIILATLHYGDLTMLYHWLRSRGVGVAFMVHRDREPVAPMRDRLDGLADRANGLDGVPRLFLQDQLWEAHEFLTTPGRVLAIAIEQTSKRYVLVNGDGYSLPVSLGALRMAAIAGAVVIPCLISSPGCLRSTIRFGSPVPDADVASRNRHEAACGHIVRQLAPWIVEKPEECGKELLAAFGSPANPAGEALTPPSSPRPREECRS